MGNKILNKSKVYTLKPKDTSFSPYAYDLLNKEIENIVRNTLNFSIQIAEANGRKSIRAEDIKLGLSEYLESFGGIYLKLIKETMFNELKTFFEEKEKVVEENANRRFSYTRTAKKE